MKASIKNAQCPNCGSLRWFIHDETSGIGAKTCMQCGFTTTAITEWELFLGTPVDPYASGRLKEARISRNAYKRRGHSLKGQFYVDNIEKIKADWHKGGRDLVLKNWPIVLSTLRQKEKLWGLVPLTDRRKNNRFRPSGKQLILV